MSQTYDSTSCYLQNDTVAIRLRLSPTIFDLTVPGLTNDFHTPNAVPRRASSPTRIGIDAIKVIALVLSAKELSRIGPSGWTVVKPISAKTTM